jgi:hypothetical protein
MKTKTVNVNEDLFKKIKIYCAENDIKIREFISEAILEKLKIKNDNK